MANDEVVLELPAEPGAEILGREVVQHALRGAHGVRVWSEAVSQSESQDYHDFGATLLLVAGTPVAAAGVKGIFDIIKTVISEAQENRRQRREHEHELHLLRVRVGGELHELDLARPLAELERELDDLRTMG